MSNNSADEIHADDFLLLTGARFGDYGIYHISESGVTARLGELDDLADLSPAEAASLLKFKREAELPFPTTRRRFLEWVGKQDGDFALPDGFEAPPASKEKTTSEKYEIPESWQYKARALAQQYMDEQRALRAPKNWPGVIEIAKFVEGELTRRGITATRGRFPDWETIKREALTGITGRKRNGKK